MLARIARLACPACIRVGLVSKTSMQIAMLTCEATHLCTYLAAFDIATRHNCAFVILCGFLIGAVVKISLIVPAHSHLCHRMVIARLIRFEFFVLGRARLLKVIIGHKHSFAGRILLKQRLPL